MKAKITLILGIFLLSLIFSQTAEAQILQTRSEIIETYGTPFSSGVLESGEQYLFYKYPVTTKNSGTYLQRKVLYLKESDNGEVTCFKWKILEPSTETNFNLTSFKENLVQIGENQWKDYGKGIVYELKVKKGVCAITAWYDSEVALAKVYKM